MNTRDVIVIGLNAGNEPLIRELRARGNIHIIGIDQNVEASCVPLVDDFLHASYLKYDRIEAEFSARNLRDPVFLAGTTADPCYGTLFRLRTRFGTSAPVDAFYSCIDKVRLEEFLQEHGYSTLETRSFDGNAPTYYPSVIKARSAKNAPVMFVESRKAYEKVARTLRDVESLIVQNAVSGDEYKVHLFPGGSHLILKKMSNSLYKNLLAHEEDGPAQTALKAAQAFCEEFDMAKEISKYDIIVHGGKAYLLDIGFDHPLRVAALLKAHKLEYWQLYVEYFLNKKSGWAKAIKSITTSYYVRGGEILPHFPKRPTFLSVDEKGNICVSDRDTKGVWIYSNAGQLLDFKPFAEVSESYFSRTRCVFEGRSYTAGSDGDSIIVTDNKTSMSETYLTRGRGPGEVRKPTDVKCVNGKIYVNDRENYRIQIFSPAMEYLGEFGHKGHKIGEFDMATSLAAEKDTLLIADTGNDRIVRYDPRTQKYTVVVAYTFEPGILRRPTAVATDAKNVVYVADRDNNAVQAFKKDGTLLWYAKAQRPSGIVCAGRNLYVLERGGRKQGVIAVFSTHGKRKKNLALKHANNPRAIALDSRKRIWVVDANEQTAHVCKTNGDEMKHIPLPSQVGGSVKDFFIGDDVLYIPDLLTSVVHVVRFNGKLSHTIDLKRTAPDIAAVRSAAAYDKTLIACARAEGKLYLFDLKGRLKKTVGEQGSSIGQFRNPVQVICTPGHDYLVVDRDNDRIVRYTNEWSPIQMYGA